MGTLVGVDMVAPILPGSPGRCSGARRWISSPCGLRNETRRETWSVVEQLAKNKLYAMAEKGDTMAVLNPG